MSTQTAGVAVAMTVLVDVLKRRAAYIRTRTGGQQKSFVASAVGDGEPAPTAFAKSGIDLIGLDPYRAGRGGM